MDTSVGPGNQETDYRLTTSINPFFLFHPRLTLPRAKFSSRCLRLRGHMLWRFIPQTLCLCTRPTARDPHGTSA